jgi:hypothetical protein
MIVFVLIIWSQNDQNILNLQRVIMRQEVCERIDLSIVVTHDIFHDTRVLLLKC